MKKLRIISLLAFLLVIGTNAYSQSFNVEWNGCKVESDSSRYHVQYALYNTTTGTFVVIPTWDPTEYLPIYNSTTIYPSWGCNQMDTKPYLYLFVHVELRDADGNPYCSGDARSSLLTCDEMYGQTTITVNMDY